uniref:Uncharacterized protein n=1 Tax=Panagrolaimus superbus TaxID=310955 RepID=A0A914YCC0_9BILA
MRYRCLCEMTDVFLDHHSINKHIDECEEVELQYHGVLIPEGSGRKRCFFVNPHSIMPSSQNIPSTYGFCEGRAAVATNVHDEDSIPEASEIKQPLPSSVAVPGSSKTKSVGNRYFRRQHLPAFKIPPNKPSLAEYHNRRIASFWDAAGATARLSYPEPREELQSHSAYGTSMDSTTFDPFPTGKPIYRPLKQQPSANFGPRLISQHPFSPRVIYPRYRMVARLLAPNAISQNVHYAAAPEEYHEENVYDDFVPLTNRVSEEENETISPKRLRPTPSDDEPEVITL